MHAFFEQKINSYLCIALISLMSYWTVLFYATHKAEAIGDQYSSSLTFLPE